MGAQAARVASLSAAKVNKAGLVVQLGSKPTPDETVDVEDVKDPHKLTRLLGRILLELSQLRRRFMPRHVDFEDLTLGATGNTSLQHNFSGRVRWWIVDYEIVGASGAPILAKNSTLTTANTLVLASYKTALVTVRVEEAG